MSLKSPVSLKALNIVAITFDLDDTLWPCAPVIKLAEQVYFDWIAQRFPELEQLYSRDEIIQMRSELLKKFPQLQNDVTELRRRATIALLQPMGGSDADVAEALRVCIEARQRVSFYDDVPEALSQLAKNYRLGSITNGNASLKAIGIDHLFDVELAATMSQPAKPAPHMFAQACDVFEVEPQCVLHVGDHPHNDVAAAREAGFKTAWINRDGLSYPDDLPPADVSISDLTELVSIAAIDSR